MASFKILTGISPSLSLEAFFLLLRINIGLIPSDETKLKVNNSNCGLLEELMFQYKSGYESN